MEDLQKQIIDFLPKEIKMSGLSWEPIISAETKIMSKGSFSILRIRDIEIPKNSIAVLVNFIKNLHIEVVDILISEKPGILDSVVVYVNQNCTVKKDELIGFLKLSPAIPTDKIAILEFFKKLRGLHFESLEEYFLKTQWPVW